MGTRRGNNEGTIYKRSDGRWHAQLTLPDGTRKSFYGKTRKEVEGKLHDARQALKQSLAVPNERRTVAQFFGDWLETRQPPRIKATTYMRYQRFAAQIVAEVGRVPIARLSPDQVEAVYAKYLKDGLSPTTVNHLHALFHVALEKAVRLGLVARNVCDLVDPPPVEHKERPTWTLEQVLDFLEAASGDAYEAVYWTLFFTGARWGELFALRWPDIDFKAGTLSIRSTLSYVHGEFLFSAPKTARSRRTLRLADLALEALQTHRTRQKEQRLRMGDAWDGSLNLVFPNEIGRPMEASHFLRQCFYPLIEKAGNPPIHFHDGRHTVASLMTAEGIENNAISGTLGHGSEATTWRFYGHLVPKLGTEAVEKMARLLRKRESLG